MIDSSIGKYSIIKRDIHSEYDFNEIANPNKKNVSKTNEASSNSSIEVTSILTASTFASNGENYSLKASKRSTSDAYTDTNDSDLVPELDLKEFIKSADENKFPKKEFMISNKIKTFTPMLHFFKSIRIFKQQPEEHERLNYECKICEQSFLSPFTDKSDLYKHLNRHADYKKWNEKYCKSKGRICGPVIDDSMLLLIKYFVTSNASHSSLENKY